MTSLRELGSGSDRCACPVDVVDHLQNSAIEQVKSGPILTLPLLTIADYSHLLRDVPVCQVSWRIFDVEFSSFWQKSRLSAGELILMSKFRLVSLSRFMGSLLAEIFSLWGTSLTSFESESVWAAITTRTEVLQLRTTHLQLSCKGVLHGWLQPYLLQSDKWRLQHLQEVFDHGMSVLLDIAFGLEVIRKSCRWPMGLELNDDVVLQCSQ